MGFIEGLDERLPPPSVSGRVFALLVSQIETRAGGLAAVGAGAVAVVATGLPFNLGLLVAGLVGAVVGAAADARGWAR